MTKYVAGGRGWLSDAAAESLGRIDSAFGSLIPTTSLGRTWADQNTAYQLYKSGRGPLALPPGQSVHEAGNAADYGNRAWAWLGSQHGLGWNGARANGFGWRRTVSSEQWHYEYDKNRDLAYAQQMLGITVDGIDGPQTQAALRAYQERNGLTADGKFGGQTRGHMDAHGASAGGQWPAREKYGHDHVVSVQDRLKRLGYDIGESDGKDGPKTQAAVRDFQSKNGLDVDGIAGPATSNKLDEVLAPKVVGRNATARQTVEIQKFLAAKGYSLGEYGADGDYGADTTAAVIAYQKAEGLNPDGIWGELTDARAFPPATTPPIEEWPVNGRNATTRPTADIQRLVGADPDSVYGPETSRKVAAWQKANGLDPDGIWGPASDAKGFPGVALPDAPADPTADPLYGKKTPTYPGASWADVSPNKSVRTEDVDYFVIHHAADTSTLTAQRRRFMTANDRNVSPNWLIGADGSVSEIVPPDDYRAWTTGAFDHQAVTVETQNTSGDPAWGISEASHEAIARLVAWAAERYDFPIDRAHVIGHREVPGQATACPGPSMNLDRIVELAQQYATGEPAPDTVAVERSWLQSVLDKLKHLLGGAQ